MARTSGRRDLSPEERQQLVGFLIALQDTQGELPIGAFTWAAINDAGMQGWKIVVRRQPPKSPDLNILDLGFFNAIQALQYQTQANSVDTLVTAVENAFNEMKVKTLEKCFLTLQ